MRDLLVISVFIPWALMSLKRPWLGVLLWTWMSLMNPHRLAWGFVRDAPLAAIAAVVTLIGLLATKERESPFKGAPVTIFLAFTVWITLSWLMGVDVSGTYLQWNKVMKINFMLFVSLCLLQSRHHIMAFVWVTVGSLAVLGVKGGIFTVLHGGSFRVYGPPGTFIEDNNEFALALIIIIPMLHFLQLQVSSLWARHGISISMLLCAASSLGSHSRGGFLAIAAMGATFWLRSHRKGFMFVMIAIVFLAILPIMPEEWWQRMSSIGEYQADASAQGRIRAWNVAWQIALHHPFGGGMTYQNPFLFNLYGEGNNTMIAAHSIYFQVLGNHGFVGLFLFLALWFVTFFQAGKLRKLDRSNPQMKWASDLGSMIQVGLVGYAVGGAFLSLAYFDLPYNMMVMVVLTRKWVETRGWEREPNVSLLEYMGLRRPKKVAGGMTPLASSPASTSLRKP